MSLRGSTGGRRSHRGLAVADPAVVRRHAAVREDAEAARLQPRASWPRAGAGSGTCRRRGRRAAARRPRRRRRQRRPRRVSWKAAAISACGAARREVVVHRLDERGAVAEAPWIRLGRSVARELLELDRRLALVRDLGAHAEQRRDRVEEAAHARRERRVRLQRLADRRASARTEPAGRRARGTRRPSATARGSRPRRPAAAPGRGGRARSNEARSQRRSSPPQSVPSVP